MNPGIDFDRRGWRCCVRDRIRWEWRELSRIHEETMFSFRSKKKARRILLRISPKCRIIPRSYHDHTTVSSRDSLQFMSLWQPWSNILTWMDTQQKSAVIIREHFSNRASYGGEFQQAHHKQTSKESSVMSRTKLNPTSSMNGSNLIRTATNSGTILR